MKHILRIGFVPIFIFIAIALLIGPFMALDDIRTMLQYGTPNGSIYLFMIGFCSFILYLSVRVKAFQVVYHKYAILLPILQMALFLLMGMGFAATILNQWAEYNFPSRGVAIFLGVLSFILVRVFMSWWYHKHPVAPLFQSKEEWK